MGKRIICKKAICRFNGSAGDEMRATLIKRQYPQGSVFVSKRDILPIGCDLEKDFNALENKRPTNTFSIITPNLLSEKLKQHNDDDEKQEKVLTKQKRN